MSRKDHGRRLGGSGRCQLADVARRYRCRLRLEGLDAAIAAAVGTTVREDDEPPG